MHRRSPPHCAISTGSKALLLWVLLLAAVACGSQPATAHLYAIGETAEVDGWRVTVHSFSRLPADAWRQPQAGHVFCVVELTLENASGQIRYVMPEKQMLLESAGRVYNLDRTATVLTARQRQWMLPEGEFRIGVKAHGATAYQIPSASQDVRWTFRSGLFPWSRRVVFALGELPQE